MRVLARRSGVLQLPGGGRVGVPQLLGVAVRNLAPDTAAERTLVAAGGGAHIGTVAGQEVVCAGAAAVPAGDSLPQVGAVVPAPTSTAQSQISSPPSRLPGHESFLPAPRTAFFRGG